MELEQDPKEFDDAAEQMIELGNRLLDADTDSDRWEVASGLLAGAVHFWLYTRQPCGEPYCENCVDIDTAEKGFKSWSGNPVSSLKKASISTPRWMPMPAPREHYAGGFEVSSRVAIEASAWRRRSGKNSLKSLR